MRLDFVVYFALPFSFLVRCQGEAPQLNWVDPPDGATVATAPEEILVMFSEAMAASNGATLSICSQASTGCAAACSERSTATAAGFRLQRSGQLASWPIGDFQFSQGCQYTFRLQEGSFNTVRQPAEALPSQTWGFSVNIPVPRLTLASLKTATVSTLRIALTWDSDVSFTCRAEPLTPPSTVSRETEAIIGSRNVQLETELQGLIPGTSYTVKCLGHHSQHSNVQSGWATVGTFATVADTDSSLAGIRVHTIPICSSGPQQSHADQLLIPHFQPAVMSYKAYIFAEDLVQACGSLNGGAAEWTVTVDPTKRSPFASITTSWAGSSEAGDSHRLVLPAGSTTSSVSVSFTVAAHSGGQTSVYTVMVNANSTGTAASITTTPAPITDAPTTTTPAATAQPPATTCSDVEQQLGGSENFAGTNCPATVSHGESCSRRCPPGNQLIGVHTCHMGLMVGSSQCAPPMTPMTPLTKIAGVFDLQLSPMANQMDAMKAPIRRSLASALTLAENDITIVSVQGAQARRLRRLSSSSIRARYDILVRDPVSITGLLSSLTSLADDAASTERSRMSNQLVQDGYSLTGVTPYVAPFSYQDSSIQVGNPPANTAAPTTTTVAATPETGNGGEEEEEEAGGMSTGAIVGISIGAVFVAVLLGGGGFYLYQRQGFSNL